MIKLVALVLLLAGCGLLPGVPVLVYDGPARPLNEVAVLGEKSASATLNAINGRPQVSYLKENRDPKGYHVLPGVYVLKVASQIRASRFLNQVTWAWEEAEIRLDAKAGHTYLPRAARMPHGEMRSWMHDMGTNFDQECLGSRFRHCD